jgi:formylglycine-generating enzyme required for sulfatase activity
VLRGGSFLFSAPFTRSALRFNHTPDNRHFNFGFRVVVAART